MAEQPSVPMGPSIGTPSRGFRPLNTASYRSANEWLKVAAEQTKTLDILGKAWVARQEELNKAAAEAGTVAAIKGEARSEMKKNGGLFARGHREAAYDMTVGQQKAALFDSERRRAAKEFGLDPSKRAADWEAEAESRKQQFIADHNINTELSLISFNNELTKHNTQHFNIFRSANVAAMGRATEDLAFDQAAAAMSQIMDGADLQNEPSTPSGTPIPHPSFGEVSPFGAGVVQTQKGMENFAEGKWWNKDIVNATADNWVRYLETNFGDTLDPVQMNRLYKRLADHELARSDLAYHRAVVTKDEGKINDAFADYSFTYDVVNSLTKTLTDPKGVEQELSVWNAESQLALRTGEAKLEHHHSRNLKAAPEALAKEVNDALTQILPALDNLFKTPEGQWITDPDEILNILSTADPRTVSGGKILKPEITGSDTALYTLSRMVRDHIFVEREREQRSLDQGLAREGRLSKAESAKNLAMIAPLIRGATEQQIVQLELNREAWMTQLPEEGDRTAFLRKIADRKRQLQLYENNQTLSQSHKIALNTVLASPTITKAVQEENTQRADAAFMRWVANTAKTNEKVRDHLATGGDLNAGYLNLLVEDESKRWKQPARMQTDATIRMAMFHNLYSYQALQTAIEDAHLKVFEDKLNEKDSNGSFVISDQQLTDWGMVDKDGNPNRSVPALDGGHPGLVAFIDSIDWSQLDLWRHIPGNENYTAKEGPDLTSFLSTDLSAPIEVPEAPTSPATVTTPSKGTSTTSAEEALKEYNFGAVDAEKLLSEASQEIAQRIVGGEAEAQKHRDLAQELVTSIGWRDFFGGEPGWKRLGVGAENLFNRALRSTGSLSVTPATPIGDYSTTGEQPGMLSPVLHGIEDTPLPPKGSRTFWEKITGAPSTAENPQIQIHLERAAALDKEVAMLKLIRSSADRNTVRFGGPANWQRALFWQIQENIKNKTFNDTDASLADENNSEATYQTGTRDLFKAGRGSWVTDAQNVTTLWGGLNASIFGKGNGVDPNGNRIWLNEEQTLNAINADWVSYTDGETTGKFYQLSLMARLRGKNTPETLARYMTLVLKNQTALRTVKKFPDENPLFGFQLPQQGKTTAQTRQDAVRVYGEPRPSLLSIFSRSSPQEKRRAQSWQKFALPSEFAEEYPEEADKIMKSLQRATAALVSTNTGPGGFPVSLILVTDKGTAAQLRTAKENVPEWYRDRIFKPPSDGTSLKDANVHELQLLPLPERVQAATTFVINKSREASAAGWGSRIERNTLMMQQRHIPTSILNALTNAEGYGSSK